MAGIIYCVLWQGPVNSQESLSPQHCAGGGPGAAPATLLFGWLQRLCKEEQSHSGGRSITPRQAHGHREVAGLHSHHHQ